ncbi:MAG: hypothetical protein F6K47_35175 [Symploca sp. SIO2E6]|nr:hypothetical protein [Symploca sp. SIO2E6]
MRTFFHCTTIAHNLGKSNQCRIGIGNWELGIRNKFSIFVGAGLEISYRISR